MEIICLLIWFLKDCIIMFLRVIIITEDNLSCINWPFASKCNDKICCHKKMLVCVLWFKSIASNSWRILIIQTGGYRNTVFDRNRGSQLKYVSLYKFFEWLSSSTFCVDGTETCWIYHYACTAKDTFLQDFLVILKWMHKFTRKSWRNVS